MGAKQPLALFGPWHVFFFFFHLSYYLPILLLPHLPQRLQTQTPGFYNAGKKGGDKMLAK